MRIPRTAVAVLLLLLATVCSRPAALPVRPAGFVEPSLSPGAASSFAPVLPEMPGGPSTVVVRTLLDRFEVYRRPGSTEPIAWTLWATNPWGQPLEYPVLKVREVDGAAWLRVRLPIRPNGSTGWVRADQVRWRTVKERIVVDLSEHTLWHYRGGRLRTTLTVAVGAPETPTPPGSYFVWAQVSYDHPNGPYGAYALGLSGFSRVLRDWPGGGRLAIHGTGDPADIGRNVSNGCVRVYNPDLLRTLRGVPLGTPVLIRP